MGIRERFFNRTAQPKEIPSGAYEDFLETQLTGKPSDPEVEGPQTLIDVPPQRDPDVLQQEDIPYEAGDPNDPSGDQSGLKYSPLSPDLRMYYYLEEQALPSMMNTLDVLYYLQEIIDQQNDPSYPADDKYFDTSQPEGAMLESQLFDAGKLVKEIVEYLQKRVLDSGMELENAGMIDETKLLSDEELEQISQEYGENPEKFQQMLERLETADPFEQGPFGDPEDLGQVDVNRYGDIGVPEKQFADQRELEDYIAGKQRRLKQRIDEARRRWDQ